MPVEAIGAGTQSGKCDLVDSAHLVSIPFTPNPIGNDRSSGNGSATHSRRTVQPQPHRAIRPRMTRLTKWKKGTKAMSVERLDTLRVEYTALSGLSKSFASE